MTSYASSIKRSSEALIQRGEKNNGNWRKGLGLGNYAKADCWRLGWGTSAHCNNGTLSKDLLI